MTDTDITALVERLRNMAYGMPQTFQEAADRNAASLEAADALEALQKRVHYAEGVADMNIARAKDAEAALAAFEVLAELDSAS